MKKVIAGDIPPRTAAAGLKPGNIPPEKYFTFSLKHWKQIDYFGLAGKDSGWVIALLDRLHDLSREKVARFFDDRQFRESIRHHTIRWNGEGVKFAYADLNWLPAEILGNPNEFEIYQISISRAEGRIHGYWDADGVFQIVLIDPMHNLQPSDYSDHDIRHVTGGLFFPECLRTEYHEIRQVMERHAQTGSIERNPDAIEACGIGAHKLSTGWNLDVRVTTAGGTALYKLDRWE